MANRWTKEQKQAIDARGSDLLIAAAAGSGKTAVLVERIITKLLREEQEIDRLLAEVGLKEKPIGMWYVTQE